MENIQVHFAKYLEKHIWDEKNQKKVLLIGVKKNNLQYINGSKKELSGNYNRFRILVSCQDEIVSNNIPGELAVILVSEVTVRKYIPINPDMFLKKIKDSIYDQRGLSDELMWRERNNRSAIYKEPRQVIMACYFCAFERMGVGMTLSRAGSIYEKDHATVLHAIKRVNNDLDTVNFFRGVYNEAFDLTKTINRKSRLHI